VFSRSRIGWSARLVPVALAGYESRYLLGSMGRDVSALHGLVARSDLIGLAVAIVLGLGAAVLLREMSRGLAARIPRPRSSPRLVGLWLLCSAVLMLCFSCVELLHGAGVVGRQPDLTQVLGAGGWSSIPAALLVGFLVAAWLSCARWALRAVADWCRPRGAPLLGTSADHAHVARQSLLRLGPVADGWSSRGPPLHAPVAVGVR